MSFSPDRKLIADHRVWLGQFDPRHGKDWHDLLGSDPQAAMCEAAFRRLLQAHGVEVIPNKAWGQETPDFKCQVNGRRFYAEVTCLTIQRITDAGKYPDGPLEGGCPPSIMHLVRSKCSNKAPQCAACDGPALVCVGTFHRRASCDCVRPEFVEELLHGEVQEVVSFNRETGAITPVASVASFDNSVTTYKRGQVLESRRQPLSGVIVAGFGDGSFRPAVLGMLHYDARRPFDRAMLPSVPFCRLVWRDSGRKVCAEWLEAGQTIGQRDILG